MEIKARLLDDLQERICELEPELARSNFEIECFKQSDTNSFYTGFPDYATYCSSIITWEMDFIHSAIGAPSTNTKPHHPMPTIMVTLDTKLQIFYRICRTAFVDLWFVSIHTYIHTYIHTHTQCRQKVT